MRLLVRFLVFVFCFLPVFPVPQERARIDRKTKELIAIAASLGFQCEGCLEGHVKKAIQYGATKEEISEAICISMGVAAASVVDQTDVIAKRIQHKFFD